MDKISEIRLANLKILAEEAGNISELARRLGYKQPSYLYQVINQTAIQNGKPKNVGKKMARKIEAAMRKEIGWMDTPHQNYNADNINVANNYNRSTNTFTGTSYHIEVPESGPDKGHPSEEQMKALFIKALPLFDIDQAVAYAWGKGFDSNIEELATGHVSVFMNHISHTFGLKMLDDTMLKPNDNASIRKGDILIIEPEIEERDGDVVLIAINNNGHKRGLIAVLGIDMSGNRTAYQIGKSDRPEPMPENAEVLGVVISIKRHLADMDIIDSRVNDYLSKNKEIEK